MKYKLLFIFFFFILSSFSQNVSKKITALFIGNSYTYVNNLPQLVHDIAIANNDTLFFDSNTIGGYTLQNHSTDAVTISKINSQKWDNVILQAQSQEPSIDSLQVATQTTPFMLKLDSMIKTNDSCTITTFYETWGRKYGDATFCGTYPPVCTYLGMQQRLKESYKLFADTTKGIMSPAGEAFRLSIQLDSNINLYQSDYSHPSLEGSYLTACVFYEVLFHKNVVNDTFLAGLSPVAANFLQQVAHTVVSDSLSLWNLGINVPYAPFTFTANNLQYQFNSNSYFNHQWYFGDGNTSSQTNPLYTYSSAQTYTVSHVVSNLCFTDSFVVVINAGVNSISVVKTEKIAVFPNPVKDLIYFSFSDAYPVHIKIYSMMGALQKEAHIEKVNASLSVSDLSPGCYFIETNTSLQRIKFIKE